MAAEPEILNPQFPVRNRLPRVIAIWFFVQVTLNIAAAAYLTLNPPPEPASLFDKVDLTINTGVNLALGIGFWRFSPWAWPTAVVLVPLYWTLHLWHMVVPEEGLLLWPFLLVDALILAYLLGPSGRRAFSAPEASFKRFSYLPPVMGGLALYAALAPILGLTLAAAMGIAVVFVGWRRQYSRFQISD